MTIIAAIGDSITDAVGRNSVTDTGQWLHRLLERLGESSIALSAYSPPSTPTTPNNKLTGATYTAYNLGVGGQTSAQVLDRFDTDAVALAPDVVIIAVGHNDLYYGTDPATTAGNVEAMVQQAQAAGMLALLANIAPWDDATPTNETDRATLSGLYDTLASDYGLPPVVDWSSAITAADTLPDGIHPNVGAQQPLADAFDIAFIPAVRYDTTLATQVTVVYDTTMHADITDVFLAASGSQDALGTLSLQVTRNPAASGAQDATGIASLHVERHLALTGEQAQAAALVVEVERFLAMQGEQASSGTCALVVDEQEPVYLAMAGAQTASGSAVVSVTRALAMAATQTGLGTCRLRTLLPSVRLSRNRGSGGVRPRNTGHGT